MNPVMTSPAKSNEVTELVQARVLVDVFEVQVLDVVHRMIARLWGRAAFAAEESVAFAGGVALLRPIRPSVVGQQADFAGGYLLSKSFVQSALEAGPADAGLGHLNRAALRAVVAYRWLAMRLRPSSLKCHIRGMTADATGLGDAFGSTTLGASVLRVLAPAASAQRLSQESPGASALLARLQFHFPSVGG